MVTVKIPSIWRSACKGESVVQVSPGTLLQVLIATVVRYPLLRPYLFKRAEEVNPVVNIFINQEHMRYRGGLQTLLEDGDEIYIMPMITGGN